ncbi:MAG TPA: hypothetical protein PKD52_04520 [Clostridiales bacterium]|nr:hypothetical protein [Clostridiales bacterium]
MKKKWLHLVFTILLTGAFLIAFTDMAAGMIASQQPAAVVRGNHAVTVVQKDAVITKVKDSTAAATDAVNAMVAAQTIASETASAVTTETAQETVADSLQTCVNHTFSSWKTVIAPTVNDCGLQRRSCTICNHEETQVLAKLTAENNSVCIPSANMIIPFVLTELNQTNVDAYGAVCDLDFFKTYFGTNDIMVSGHRTNTIGALYHTAVGDEITLNLNGNLTAYTVIVSEEAIVAVDGKDYIGVNTGTRFVTASYDRQALRMYTCYGEGRWIVVALS